MPARSEPLGMRVTRGALGWDPHPSRLCLPHTSPPLFPQGHLAQPRPARPHLGYICKTSFPSKVTV